MLAEGYKKNFRHNQIKSGAPQRVSLECFVLKPCSKSIVTSLECYSLNFTALPVYSRYNLHLVCWDHGKGDDVGGKIWMKIENG